MKFAIILLLGMMACSKKDDGKPCSYYSATVSYDYTKSRAECLEAQKGIPQPLPNSSRGAIGKCVAGCKK